MPEITKPPKVFISYAWEDGIKDWVRDFATRLRFNGVETILDQWTVALGDSLPEFMERSVSASDFVLIVCTPAYKRKSDSSDPSGVGYEKGVITGELFVKQNQRKFIPVLRKGDWLESAPSWVLGKSYIDLRGSPLNEDNYQELLRTLYGKREPPPPLGIPPKFSNKDIGGDNTETTSPVPRTKRAISYQPEKQPKSKTPLSVFVGIALFGFGCLIWAMSYFNQQSSALPIPTSTRSVEKDGMLLAYVPAGNFKMGSDTGEPGEKPVHTVYLDSFYIDQTEVTNAMYDLCVKNNACDPPSSTKSHTRDSYYGNPDFKNYPVIYISWRSANSYCTWADRRLPTEAEWEKAARGDNGQINPWGDGIDCNRANYYSGSFYKGSSYCVGDTSAVGSYKSGKSPYGALDMAGNVWELVADLYGGDYYYYSPSNNPQGPSSSDYPGSHVVRGGSWDRPEYQVRSTMRGWVDYTEDSYYDIGFRCAKDAP